MEQTIVDNVASDTGRVDALPSLESAASRSIMQIGEIKKEIAQFKDMLDKGLENNQDYAKTCQAIKDMTKERNALKKKVVQHDTNLVRLQVQIKELQTEKRELGKGLSDYLINIEALTGQLSFNFNGELVEFDKVAKLKEKKQ